MLCVLFLLFAVAFLMPSAAHAQYNCCGRAFQTAPIHCCTVVYGGGTTTDCSYSNPCYYKTYTSWYLDGTTGPDTVVDAIGSANCSDPNYTCTVDPAPGIYRRTKCGLSSPIGHLHRDHGIEMARQKRALQEADFIAKWKAGETKEHRAVTTGDKRKNVAAVSCTGGGYLTEEQRRMFL